MNFLKNSKEGGGGNIQSKKSIVKSFPLYWGYIWQKYSNTWSLVTSCESHVYCPWCDKDVTEMQGQPRGIPKSQSGQMIAGLMPCIHWAPLKPVGEMSVVARGAQKLENPTTQQFNQRHESTQTEQCSVSTCRSDSLGFFPQENPKTTVHVCTVHNNCTLWALDSINWHIDRPVFFVFVNGNQNNCKFWAGNAVFEHMLL